MKAYRNKIRKPISLYDEIELLSQYPFGGLIGGELLPHDLTGLEIKNPQDKARRGRRYRNIKRYRKEEEVLKTRNL